MVGKAHAAHMAQYRFTLAQQALLRVWGCSGSRSRSGMGVRRRCRGRLVQRVDHYRDLGVNICHEACKFCQPSSRLEAKPGAKAMARFTQLPCLLACCTSYLFGVLQMTSQFGYVVWPHLSLL